MNDSDKEIERLKALLGKYIAHVLSCEGTDFIGDHYNYGYFSKDEMKELESYRDRL